MSSLKKHSIIWLFLLFIVLNCTYSKSCLAYNKLDIIGRVPIPETGYITAIAVVGNYIYSISYSGGFKIIDISDIRHPAIVGSVDNLGQMVMKIEISGNYAYLASPDSGLYIVDITNKTAPYLTYHSLNMSMLLTSCNVVKIKDNYAYLEGVSCFEPPSLIILDISEPSDPKWISSYKISSYDNFEINIENNNLYLGRSLIFDITNPYIPELITNALLPTYDGSMIIVNNYAYYVNDDIGLTIMDIASLTKHVLVSNFVKFDNNVIEQVNYNNEYIYLLHQGGIFSGIDVSNNAIPRLTCCYQLEYPIVNTMTVIDNHIYVVNDYGLSIIEIRPAITSLNKIVEKNTQIQFNDVDFDNNFSSNNKLINIKFITLPENGILQLSGIPIVVNQIIPKADIKNLTYIPNINWSGIESFNWNASDGKTYANNAAQINIVIANDNNAPVVSAFTKLNVKNTVLNFIAQDFTNCFQGRNNSVLNKVKIVSLSQYGDLYLNKTAVIRGQELLVSELYDLNYTPLSNWIGEDWFYWNGFDGELYAENTAKVKLVTSPGALVISDVVKSGIKNKSVKFSTDDFINNFIDTDQDNLQGIKITRLPINGVLRLSGVDIALDQEISTNQLNNLVYIPKKNWIGTDNCSWNGTDGIAYAIKSQKLEINIKPTWIESHVGATIGIASGSLLTTSAVVIVNKIVKFYKQRHRHLANVLNEVVRIV